MDLISWSLNAIDQIYSNLKTGVGEPACPGGTFSAGYVMDSWGVWKVMCLSILSVEDAEDVYIFGFMITGFLLFGAGSFLAYRKIRTLSAVTGKLSYFCAGVCRATHNQTLRLQEINRKLEAQDGKLVTISELVRKLDTNLERLSARLDENGN